MILYGFSVRGYCDGNLFIQVHAFEWTNYGPWVTDVGIGNTPPVIPQE